MLAKGVLFLQDNASHEFNSGSRVPITGTPALFSRSRTIIPQMKTV
jgi:hypothetical protein